jgi:hypothetical protein
MADFELIAKRIAERLEAVGLSERKASMIATGQPDAIRYIRTRGTMPSVIRMMKISNVLKATPTYLFGDVDTNDWEENATAIGLASRFNDAAAYEQRVPGRSVPVHGVKASSDDADASLTVYGFTKEIVGFAAPPRGYEDHLVGAFYPVDSSMSPLYEPATPVVFSHKVEAKVGEHALVFLTGSFEGKEIRSGTFLLRKLVDKTDEWVTLQQHTPSRMMRLPTSVVQQCLRAFVMRDYIMPDPASDE